MAIALTETKQGVFGDIRYWIGTLALDSSYPTNGEALAAADVPGLSTEIQFVLIDGSAVATKRLVWDPSASKVVVFVEDGTSGIEAEAANASDQSAITDVQVLILGY